jgi:hypothetical protein
MKGYPFENRENGVIDRQEFKWAAATEGRSCSFEMQAA